MTPDTIYHLGATFALVVGSVWALRTKLSDIEVAIKGHIEKDAEVHKSQDARLIKLEGRRRVR